MSLNMIVFERISQIQSGSEVSMRKRKKLYNALIQPLVMLLQLNFHVH